MLREREVAKHFGVARSSIRRWVNAGIFPRPVRIGPDTIRWREEDIETFEKTVVEKRDLSS